MRSRLQTGNDIESFRVDLSSWYKFQIFLCLIKYHITKDYLQTTWKIYTGCFILNELKLKKLFRGNLIVSRRLLKGFHDDGPITARSAWRNYPIPDLLPAVNPFCVPKFC